MRGTLVRVLLRVVGCVLIAAALAAAWYASGKQEGMQGQVATIGARQGERGKRISAAKADELIAEAEAKLESMQMQMYIAYGAAAALLVVGVLLVALPSGAKRKAPAVAAEPPPP